MSEVICYQYRSFDAKYSFGYLFFPQRGDSGSFNGESFSLGPFYMEPICAWRIKQLK